ncbi:DUF6069 family protein [Cellulomonas sp. HZM]|uniref:DUF6069 family protein n=1 Tax=Cellulomonas sp. HZM TaxID=1454010 RepID=UPI00068EA7ED|nr:DUF6069 family protein [Cellulomonas sp. HZM]
MSRLTQRPVWSVVLLAVAAALLVWLLAVPLAHVELDVQGSAVGPVAVAVSAALAVLLAWPVRTLLAGRTRAVPAWRVTCGVVLLLSLVAPLGADGAGARAVLVAMHVVVGAVVVVGLEPRRAGEARASGRAVRRSARRSGAASAPTRVG